MPEENKEKFFIRQRTLVILILLAVFGIFISLVLKALITGHI